MTRRQHLEIVLFDKAIKRVQAYFKPVGFHIGDIDRNKSTWKSLRLWFLICLIWVYSIEVGQISGLVQNASSGKSLVQLTSIAPCLAFCVLSNIQIFFFVNRGHQVCELIQTIRTFQSRYAKKKLENADVIFLKHQMKIFYIAVNALTVASGGGVAAFGISPIVTMAKSYYSTGEVTLALPFLLGFPFDIYDTDIRFWPILYVHQIWSAGITVLTVLAPGFLCYACSTFIIFQFRILHNDLEKVIPVKYSFHIKHRDEELRRKLMNIIDRHGKLIAFVDLMEIIYSESTLYNVITSTFLICLTGFNVTTIEDFAEMVPFLQFLMLSLIQIYVLCYYGDTIMIYSMKVADAAYNCQWYRAETSIVKDLMIISARARKPCKMTAFKFSDLNFKTFTKILSSSWSYFALLTSIYRG